MLIPPLSLTAAARPEFLPVSPVPIVRRQPGGRSDTPFTESGEPTSTRPADTVEISAEAQQQADAQQQFVSQLSESEQAQLQKLKTRDREVRSHEQAHLAAAGPYASGGPSYEYQKGPDGQRYAVGGEVSIDVSPVPDDPEATINKAQIIRAAAMAPAKPSGQDRRVAAAASRMAAEAQRELRETRRQEGAEVESSADAEKEEMLGVLLDMLA